MKKYIIFVVSFIVLFSLFEVLSGMFLTYMYVPDVNRAWQASGGLVQEVVIQGESSPFEWTLLMGLLAATIAFFIAKRRSY